LQGNSANAASWATKDAVLNGFSNVSPNAITSSCSGTSCTVTLSIQHNIALASAFLPTVTIRAQAKAELKSFDPGNVACIIATGLGTVLDFLAQNATSSMPNCTLVVPNAPRADSVTIANGSVTADTIWSHGGKATYAIDLPNSTTLSCPTCTCSSTQGGTGVTFIMIPDASGVAGGVSIAGNSSYRRAMAPASR
jgi:hypothetical protein